MVPCSYINAYLQPNDLCDIDRGSGANKGQLTGKQFSLGGGGDLEVNQFSFEGGIFGHSPLYYRTIHMFLVFVSLTFFYQIVNIKVLNNVKTNNVFKSIYCKKCKFKHQISVLKNKNTPIG